MVGQRSGKGRARVGQETNYPDCLLSFDLCTSISCLLTVAGPSLESTVNSCFSMRSSKSIVMGRERVGQGSGKGRAKVGQRSGRGRARNSKFNRALSMNPSASNVVNGNSIDYPVYSHLTMRVTGTMGMVKGGSKKKAVKV